MAFQFLDKYAQNDDATRAIFEHFRNMGVVVAVQIAATWLHRNAAFNSLHGVLAHLGSAVLAFTAFGLLWIAITNAGIRLGRAGFSRRGWNVVLWVVYCSLGVAGWMAYASR